MHRILDLLYLGVLVLLAPWLFWRAWRTGRYREGLRLRLRGLGPEVEVPPDAVWFHGVSVGEIHMLRQLVAAFRARHPGRTCIVSSTTDTGLAEARKAFGDLVVVPFPFDFSWAVRRTLEHVRPALIVLGESELWPNFLLAAGRLGVPVTIVNGRMSPRSLGRYQIVAPLVRWMFRSLKLVAVQTDEYAANILALGGVPGQVRTTGNIKYDGARTDRDNPLTASQRTLFGIDANALVWVAGSTQAPEEQYILDIYRRAKERHAGLRLFLVPRQKDRFDEVARLIEATGLPFVRRSMLPEAGLADIVLVDTIGELGPLWGLADLAFVGGSMDGKRGGQNMIEPAAFGAAVTFGSHVWNFKDPAARLVAHGGAVQVQNATELEQETLRLLEDAVERRAIGRAARAFVLAQQGATQRTLDLLDSILANPREQAAA